MTEKLLKPDDVAKILGLSPRTVLLKARKGKLPAYKIGGLWRFRPIEIERYINQSPKTSIAENK